MPIGGGLRQLEPIGKCFSGRVILEADARRPVHLKQQEDAIAFTKNRLASSIPSFR